MPFIIERATKDDAATIAKILIDDPSDFFKLRLGTVDIAEMIPARTQRIASSIESSDQAFVVARDCDTHEVVSFAEWILPKEHDKEPIQKNSIDEEREAEELRKKLSPGQNADLTVEFHQKYTELRRKALQGRRHFLLGNLSTLAHYRRQGAASALVRWAFEPADREGVLIYLDTDGAGNARQMYEKLGFRLVGSISLDLTAHGGKGIHTHIAMIREPQAS